LSETLEAGHIKTILALLAAGADLEHRDKVSPVT